MFFDHINNFDFSIFMRGGAVKNWNATRSIPALILIYLLVISQ